jgi:hypothetical protein
MRALKVLVVVMGILLVGGLVVLVVTIVNRAARPGEAARPGFGTVVVDLPAGAVLAGRDVVGDRIVLTLALPGGGHRLLVFEPRSGAVLGSLELRSP